MKKVIVALCLCLCVGVAAVSLIHWHSWSKWKADKNGHWKVCEECGEADHYALHDFSQGYQCAGCSAYIYENGDGSSTVELYDEEGPRNFAGKFDKENRILSYERFENTYFEDGNIETMKAYGYDADTDEAGTERILWEYSYQPYGEGDAQTTYLHKEIQYDKDGSKETIEYSPEGEIISKERS